jgi:hypothetical protein
MSWTQKETAAGVEQRQHLLGDPALLAELEDVGEVGRQEGDELLQPVGVARPARRQLVEDRADRVAQIAARERNSSTGSAQSLSFFMWVMKRGALTA